jgi:hypothetical protein
LRLSVPERATLAETERHLGRKALREVTCVAKPEPILIGTEGSSPRSSMAPNSYLIQAAPQLNWKEKI